MNPISSSPRADVKLNVGIRAYVRAANDIMKSSSSRWLCQPEIPTSAEILPAGDDDVVLPANKIDGPWKSKDKYLKAHYNLLREDAVSPLRDAVEILRQNPDMMESDSKVVSIYEKVNLSWKVHIATLTP
jgi:helicase required for RNAi-mediated heterochromatin assembly 1